MTLSEAAKIAGVTTATLRRAALMGTLRARKAGPRAWLVTMTALRAWMANPAYHRTAHKKYRQTGA